MEGNGEDVPVLAKPNSWPSLFSASFHLFFFTFLTSLLLAVIFLKP